MKRQLALLLSVFLLVTVLASCGRTQPYEPETAETTETTEIMETTSFIPTETTADIIPYRVESAPPPPFPYYQEENAYLCYDYMQNRYKYVIIYHVYNRGTQPIIVYPYEFKVRWSEDNKSGNVTSSFTPAYLFGGEDGYVTIEALFPSETVSKKSNISYSGTVAWRPAKQQVKLYAVGESRLEACYDRSTFQGISIEAALEDESVSRVLQLNLTIFDKEGIPLRSFSGSGTALSGSLLFFFPLYREIDRKDIASYEISVSDMCWESIP
jgi:lipoprotein